MLWIINKNKTIIKYSEWKESATHTHSNTKHTTIGEETERKIVRNWKLNYSSENAGQKALFSSTLQQRCSLYFEYVVLWTKPNDQLNYRGQCVIAWTATYFESFFFFFFSSLLSPSSFSSCWVRCFVSFPLSHQQRTYNTHMSRTIRCDNIESWVFVPFSFSFYFLI